MPRSYQDDADMHDVLSSIMHGQAPTPVAQHAPRPAAKPQAAAPRPVHEIPLQQPTYAPAKPKKAKRQRRGSRKLLLVPLFIILIGGGVFLSGWVLTKLSTQSPFSQELVSKTSYPLLYPTKLPTGYHIDKTSVNQAENGAVVYTIKNKDAAINISLQEQPANLNLKPLLDTMSSVRKVEAPAGETTVGLAQDNLITANTLSGKVWVIVRVTPNTITDQEFDNLLRSFKEGL